MIVTGILRIKLCSDKRFEIHKYILKIERAQL